MKLKSVLALAMAWLLACCVAFAGDNKEADAKEKAAAEVAQQWLKTIDAGNFGESWDGAATIFKEKVTREQWQGAMQQVRVPLGKVNSRKVKVTNYVTALPNVPKGEYVIVQFESSFDGMNHAIETVTPYMDKDGHWRVAGYYIKPAQM